MIVTTWKSGVNPLKSVRARNVKFIFENDVIFFLDCLKMATSGGSLSDSYQNKTKNIVTDTSDSI